MTKSAVSTKVFTSCLNRPGMPWTCGPASAGKTGRHAWNQHRYLKDHRKVLGGSRPELVFVSGRNPNKLWGEGLNKRFASITKRYVPGCPGVGPQSLRHLVCSSIIMRGGGSDESVRLAALTLHDHEETIRRHYEHLLSSFTDRARKESLGSSLAQMALKTILPTSPPNQTA